MKVSTLVRMACVLVLSACVAQAPLSQASAPTVTPNRVTAFVGVTVIRAYGERALQNQTVLVYGDRIVAVAPADRTQLPPNAVILGHPGQILAPGLADMHVHIFAENDGALFLANGVTTVRNMAGRAETDALAARIESGAAPGPHIYSSGPIINGPNPDWGAANAARTPDDARRLVSAEADAGYIGVKLYEDLAPNVFAAGVAAARARGLQVFAHVPFSMALDQVLALRIDSIEHLTGFDRALAPGQRSDWDEERWASADTERMAALAARVARSGVWNDATLVTLLGSPRAFADIAAAEAAPDYRYATPRLRALWRGQYEASRTQRDPALAWAMTQRAHRMRLAMLRALHAAHASLLIGTDAPQPFVYPGVSLQDELALHLDAGFSRTEILRIATSEAARFLHRQGAFGVIAVGARADLLLLNADPQTDLAALRAPAGVMAAGRWYDAAALARMLDAIAAANGR